MRRAPFTAASVALLLLTAEVQVAHAGGFTITILGGRRTGMMTNIAAPDDLTAVIHNPAGLADQRGVRMHLSSGVSLMNTQVEMQALDPKYFPEVNPAGCGEAGASPCPWPIGKDGYYQGSIEPEKYFGVLPFAGVSTDLGWISPGLKDVVVALGFHAPNFYGAFLPEDAPTAYFIVEGMFMVLAATTAAAWRINDKVSVGVSLSYHYMNISFAQRLSSTDLLTPRGQEPDFIATGIQKQFGDLRLDYLGIDHGLGWGAGVLVSPTRWLTIGLSYYGATAARLEGDLEIGTQRGKLEDLQSLLKFNKMKMPHSLIVEMAIPHALHAGINFTPARWIEIGVDLRVWFYSMFDKQDMIPIYDEEPRGYEEPITAEDMSKDKRYGESWEIAVGVLVRPLKNHQQLELMAGISFDKSPAPDETWTLDNPSLDQLVISAGARYKLGERWRFAATYMVDFYLERDVTTSENWPPSNGRGYGVAHYPGLEAEYIF